MKLIYADVQFPESSFENKDLLNQIERYSEKSFDGDLNHLLSQIQWLLDLSGAKERRWIHSVDEHRSMLQSLFSRMKNKLDLPWDHRGLVISASVDKIFSEPGDAYFYAHQMGLENVECFDILDACNSHMRSWFVTQSLLRSGVYDWVIVISSECRSGYEFFKEKNKERFSFQNKKELSWRFPSLTLGDAVALSVLIKDQQAPEWPFEIISKTSNAPLCYVQSHGPRQFEEMIKNFHEKHKLSLQSEVFSMENDILFPCFYSQLELESIKPVVQVWEQLRKRMQLTETTSNEKLISHSSNASGWSGAARWAGFTDQQHFNMYSQFGNIVSCSVPAALAIAQSKGVIQNGDPVNIWTGAAGSSYFAVQFPFFNWEKN